MSIKQKAVKGALWSAIQNWGSQAGALLVFFVLARLLPPEAFGLVALANVFLAFMQAFLNQGLTQALVQRQELEPEHLDTAFWTNLAIGCLLTLISVVSADGIAALFQQPQLAPILRGFSPLFVINAFANVQQSLLERRLDFKAIALRWLTGTVVGGVVGVSLAFLGFGVWCLVAQQLVQELIGALVLWQCSPWRPGWRVSFSHFRELLDFGIPLLGFNFLTFLNTRADDFLIGLFLGPVALGYYTIAYRILGVMQQLLVNTCKQVALPTFSQFQTDLEQFRKAFYVATELTALVSFPVFLGVISLAPELIKFLFGDQWLASIPVLQILSIAGICQSVSFFKSSVFIAMGKPDWTLKLALLSSVLNLTGFALAVRWGIEAVAWAFVIRAYLLFPVGQWAVSRLIQVPLLPYLQRFVTPLVSSLGMSIVIFSAKSVLQAWLNLPVLLALLIGLGILVYGALIRLLSPAIFNRLFDLIQLAFSSSKHQNG